MTGRVLDETKAGVPGATVIVKGSTRGVITGNDGTFSIDVKPTDVIEISYLGYETQSIPVGTKTNIVTELVRKVSELEAVTVVAYGKQRKESIMAPSTPSTPANWKWQAARSLRTSPANWRVSS